MVFKMTKHSDLFFRTFIFSPISERIIFSIICPACLVPDHRYPIRVFTFIFRKLVEVIRPSDSWSVSFSGCSANLSIKMNFWIPGQESPGPTYWVVVCDSMSKIPFVSSGCDNPTFEIECFHLIFNFVGHSLHPIHPWF